MTAHTAQADLANNRPGQAALDAARDRTNWLTRLGRLLRLNTQDKSWRTGAAGERKVARTLRIARLFGWRTLHAVPLGSGKTDIDHVLIGPGGVITINTKHHRGKQIRAGHSCVFVDGQKTSYVQKSEAEGRRASELLTASAGTPIKAKPILVIVGARRIRGSNTAGIDVLNRIHLLAMLATQPRRLTPNARDHLYNIARQPQTWQSSR